MTIPTQHTLPTPYPVGAVHCYSAEINGELVLFDTGPPTAESMNYLQEHLELDRLRHVIVTHCHIDHYGLAHWLEQETDATIYLPFRDSLKIKRHHERLELIYDLLLNVGFEPHFLDRFRGSMEDGSIFPSLPENYQIIEEELPEHLGLEVLPCPGHSQSDLVLANSDWAVTGDVLLQGIFQSPLFDVDLLTGERFRNYDAYCSSLNQLAELRGKKILPGHRTSVASIDNCILFYIGKLLERSTRIKQLPADLNVAEVVTNLFGDNHEQPFLTYLKASEIIFIRDFLAHPAELQDVLQEIGLYPAVTKQFQSAVS